VEADVSKNALLFKGAIPGPKRGLIMVRTAVKAQKNVPALKPLVNYEAASE